MRLSILLMFLGVSMSLSAQKIGFVNLEAVLGLHPDMKSVNDNLTAFSSQLQEQLKIKQDYAQMKYQEFLEKGQQEEVKEEEIQAMQGELQKLQQEIQTYQAEAEQKLAARRQDEMMPIFDAVQGELDALAEEEGYEIILNAVDGTGLSLILYGPEEHNLTKRLMERLGIEIPETATAGK